MTGELWALVAAVSFGLTQTVNRKSNLLTDAYRTAFGMLVFVEILLVARAVVTGEIALVATAPIASLAYFTGSAVIHYILGWTLLALSQQRIGVARTGALVGAAPLVGSLLAVPVLGEGLTAWTLIGVVLSVAGVALVSISRDPASMRLGWSQPWLALTVAVLWGTSPLLIRRGLDGLDAPVIGLTFGLAVGLVLHAIGLTVTRSWSRGPVPGRALRWMVAGGVVGAIAISAQWLSFALTTVAVAITLQQLATLVVVGLAPVVFGTRLERLTVQLVTGTLAMMAGSVIVVLARVG